MRDASQAPRASQSQIVELRAERLDLELTEPFAIATGVQPAAHNVLVEVVLADGTVGRGEAAPLPAVDGVDQAATLAALDRLRPLVEGGSVRRWRVLAREMAAAEPAAGAARCAVEMAILDALTRQVGMPLVSFFGGAQHEVITDMTITAGDLEHAVRSARAILERGIRTIKIKVGAASPAEDAARVIAVRDAVPHARLLVDANCGWDLAGTGAFLSEVERAGVGLLLLEQPLPRDAWDDLGALCRTTRVPVFADESARSAADVVRLIGLGVRGVNIKLMKCGVVEALDMCGAARAAGLALMIGGMVESRLAMTFSAHLAAGLGDFGVCDLDTPMFIAAEPFEGGMRREGERLSVAHVERGHGVELVR